MSLLVFVAEIPLSISHSKGDMKFGRFKILLDISSTPVARAAASKAANCCWLAVSSSMLLKSKLSSSVSSSISVEIRLFLGLFISVLISMFVDNNHHAPNETNMDIKTILLNVRFLKKWALAVFIMLPMVNPSS